MSTEADDLRAAQQGEAKSTIQRITATRNGLLCTGLQPHRFKENLGTFTRLAGMPPSPQRNSARVVPALGGRATLGEITNVTKLVLRPRYEHFLCA